jgi:hypothetical protein
MLFDEMYEDLAVVVRYDGMPPGAEPSLERPQVIDKTVVSPEQFF